MSMPGDHHTVSFRLARLTLQSCCASVGQTATNAEYGFDVGGARRSEVETAKILAALPKPIEIATSLGDGAILLQYRVISEPVTVHFLARRAEEMVAHLAEQPDRKNGDYDDSILVHVAGRSEILTLSEYAAWLRQYLLKEVGFSVSRVRNDGNVENGRPTFVAEITGRDASRTFRHHQF